MSKEEQYAIKVTDMERRILIKALTILKEKQKSRKIKIMTLLMILSSNHVMQFQ